MDFPPNKIESEHHLEVVSTSSKFNLDVSSLRPYLVTQGRWFVKVQHFSSTKALEGVGIFPAGLRLVSINITSANERPLILSSFSQEVFEAHKRVLVFDHARPFLLSHPSHQLQFELQAVDGNKVVVPKESLLLLGVALIQEK